MTEPSAGAGVDPSTAFTKDWSFPVATETLAAYACRFDETFWSSAFHVDGNTRRATLPDGTVITETLEAQEDDGYTYALSGVPGVSAFVGSFEATGTNGTSTLTWTCSFQAADPSSRAAMMAIADGAGVQMTTALDKKFGSY